MHQCISVRVRVFGVRVSNGREKKILQSERSVSFAEISLSSPQKNSFYYRRFRITQGDSVGYGEHSVWQLSPPPDSWYWRRVRTRPFKIYSVVGGRDEIKTCVKLFFIEHDTRIYKRARRLRRSVYNKLMYTRAHGVAAINHRRYNLIMSRGPRRVFSGPKTKTGKNKNVDVCASPAGETTEKLGRQPRDARTDIDLLSPG